MDTVPLTTDLGAADQFGPGPKHNVRLNYDGRNEVQVVLHGGRSVPLRLYYDVLSCRYVIHKSIYHTCNHKSTCI